MSLKVDATSLMLQITESLQRLLSSLTSPPTTLIVGFSGGVDSSFLLHALACSSLGSSTSLPPLHAVYIHHGLSDQADQWQLHCQEFCEQRNIRFSAVKVQVPDLPRTSLEATARDARYDALLDICKREQGALVLGQHQDDQVETLLLALKRGSGPAGLAAMPAVSTKCDVALLRPMLNVSRSSLEAAAKAFSLEWVEDESNTDLRFDRNYLRQTILPMITARWEQFGGSVSKSAELLQEQNALLDEVTKERFLSSRNADNTLSAARIQALSLPWQRAVIRYWIRLHRKPMPRRIQLEEILQTMGARVDANPVVSMSGYDIRRYNQSLFLTESLSRPEQQKVTPGTIIRLPWWPLAFEIDGQGDFSVVPANEIKRLQVLNNPLAKTPGKWFKEWKVPPWLRTQVPVIIDNEHPVAVVLTDKIIYLSAAQKAQYDIRLVETALPE